MIYRILADLLVIIHFLFILFVLFGGLLGLWKKWIIPVHLVSAAWGAMIEFMGWICPLTPWENELRLLAGQAGYSGGFIEHYMIPVVYPQQLTTMIQLGLGSLVVLLNVVIYYFVVKRLRKTKQSDRLEM